MSRPKKPANPFGPSQEAKQAQRERLIGDTLQVLKNSHLRFDYPTHLARFVADHISKVEGNPLKSSTLLRNPRYKVLLQHSYDFHLMAGLKKEAPKSSEIPDAFGIRQLQIENSNLKHEITRLKARLSELASPRVDGPNSPVSPSVEMQPFEHDFIQTCQALERVMASLSDYVEYGSEGGIVDRAKRVNKFIVEPRLVAPFLKWRQTKGGA